MKIISILVVEDADFQRDLIEEMFLEPSVGRFELTMTDRLSNALVLLEQKPIDLVILDLGLPDSSGLETLEQILDKVPLIPVIVLTGNDDEQVGRQAIQHGAQDYLAKGSGTEILLPRICFYTFERYKAQEKAKRSQHFLSSTIDSLSAHIAIIDAEGKIIMVNKAWRDFATENGGCEECVCEGADYFMACMDNDGGWHSGTELFVENVRRVIHGEKLYFEMEYPCHSDKQERWFNARVTPLAGWDFKNVVIAHENITARKKTEIELRKNQQFLRTIFDTSPNLIFVKDDKQRYVMANKALANLFGVTDSEMFGKTDQQIAGSNSNLEKEFRQFCRYDTQVIEQQEIMIDNIALLHDRDGREMCFRTIRTPIVFPEQPAHFLGIAIDITELEQSRNKIKNSELQLRTILDTMHQSIVFLSCDLRVIWANKQALENVSGDLDRIEGCFCEHIWQAERSCENCPPKQALQHRQIVVDSYRVADGKTIRIIGCPVIDGKDELTGVVSITEDVSKIASLEEQLRQAQKMESLGTLAGGIAHDFNNILTAIMGFTELSIGIDTGNKELDRNLAEVYRAGRRAKDLVHQILTFSRRVDQELMPLDVGLVVKEVIKMLRASLPSSIELKNTISDDICKVMADPTQIHQVIMNLCTNAAHAINGNIGTISISIDKIEIDRSELPDYRDLINEGTYLALEISDTGHGIPANKLLSVFDPYFTTKEPGEGTGLGLSVVHGIISEYKGTIKVESEVGKGTTFTILLPACLDEPQPQIEQNKDQEAEIFRGKGERILVVDDEAGICYLCKRMLSKAGYDVVTESDPRNVAALDSAVIRTFDLLLTDLTMPNITGDRLALMVQEKKPGFPVIIMSGNMGKLPGNIKDNGQVSLVKKPLIRRDLLDVIAKILG